MATLDQLNAALIKADAAGNVDDARVFAAEIRRMRSETSAAPTTEVKPDSIPARQIPATLGEKIVGSPVGRFALGAAELPMGVGRFVENAAMAAGVPGIGGIGNTWDKLQAMKLKGMNAPTETSDPMAIAARAGKEMLYRGGEAVGLNPRSWDIAGMMGATVAPGAVLNKLAPAATLGKQVLQGAGVGAGLGLVNPNAKDLGSNVENAAIGAALGTVIPASTVAAAKSLGWAYDVATGKLFQKQAGKILREVAGEDVNALAAAGRAAAPELTGAQAAAGIPNTQIQALGELASGRNTGNVFSKKVALAKQDAQNILDTLAGGATQAEAKLARQNRNAALNQITTPMRETELAAANTAGNLAPALQAEATRFGEAAANKVEDVRRMTAAGERAKELSKTWISSAGGAEGLVRRPIQYTYPGQLAKKAESEATTAADASRILGENARFVQRQVDSLAAYGLTPIDTSAITANIQSKLANPKIGVSDVNKRVLNSVGKKIEEWTAKNGGVIDAEALNTIRQNTVNETVQKLIGTSDPTNQAKVAARLLREVNPMIDDAIIKAGGTGWKDYLATHAEGLKDIERQKMASVLSDLYRKGSYDKFRAIVEGNDTKAVSNVFGPSNVDIKVLMGDKILPLQKISDDLKRTSEMTDLAKQGAIGLKDILSSDATKLRLPALFSRVATVTNKVLDGLEFKVNRATFAALEKGMQSGKSMADLIKSLPTSQQDEVLRALADPKVARQITMQTSRNALAPEQQNQNALAQ
jgi:hypothetical protein